MKKIIMMVERSKDYFDAYSDNCDGIYAAGGSIDEVKADTEKAGMEKMTGINQKQLSNYLNHRAVPRKKQTERIREGIHKFAHELLSITL